MNGIFVVTRNQDGEGEPEPEVKVKKMKLALRITSDLLPPLHPSPDSSSEDSPYREEIKFFGDRFFLRRYVRKGLFVFPFPNNEYLAPIFDPSTSDEKNPYLQLSRLSFDKFQRHISSLSPEDIFCYLCFFPISMVRSFLASKSRSSDRYSSSTTDRKPRSAIHSK